MATTHDASDQDVGESWQRLDRVVRAFEEAWRRAERPAIAAYLPAKGPQRAATLAELAQVDLQWRLRAGEPARVETYLEHFPELAAEPGTLLDLIRAEYQQRRAKEPGLALEEYLARFPQFREELPARLLREPFAFASGSSISHFSILERLGSGGMGVVYKALDRQRGATVALKVMQRFDPAALYRFKQEFRSLAGISHRNLVTLYDLVAEGEQWFFTMEFVQGVNFLVYVRSAPDGPSEEVTTFSTQVQTARIDAVPPEPVGNYRLSQKQMGRLRHALGQLAEGVAALHSAGRLHRDIKPSNVLVAPEGRVVLLDFGLVTEVDESGMHQSTEHHIAGTVAYMAPEQAAVEPVSAASDWYSVGVMLYEALTGRLPFQGRPLEIMKAKLEREPPDPRECVASTPDDLNQLCVDLLRRQPAARPSDTEILGRLAVLPVEPSGATAAPRKQRPVLIGRDPHLEALRAAFLAMQTGRTTVVYVHGTSGMGKSALVEHFLDGLIEQRAAVVLAGRCYEQESVPYKALDGLVDALSRYLRRLPNAEVQALLPREIHALARVFPVLRQVGAVASAPERGAEVPDPQELRRRAFGALRELLARLGDRKRLVLFIDDLQWGDVDSAALLSELVRPPDPPVLLLVAAYRSEDIGRSKCLQALLQAPAVTGSTLERRELVERRELAVEALTAEQARDLAAALLSEAGVAAPAAAEAIGRESGGNPFFAHELVQSLRARGPEAAPTDRPLVTLDEVLWTRISRLSEEARQLLDAIAVAGRPVGQADAQLIAGVGIDQRSALDALRAGHLIRSTGLADQGEIETYHDRIRETVVGRLAPTNLIGYHQRWAVALEESGRTDAEVLAVHFQGAGDRERAGRYLVLAADQAAEGLAFDRASQLYRRALELGPMAAAEEHRLRARLGDALANAGRGAGAAKEYLSAATGSDPAVALELQRRAALQLLMSGHVDEGLAVLRTVLRAVGMTLARSPRRALLSLLFHRAQLWLRGLKFRERDANQVSGTDLQRIDITWSVSLGLGMFDIIRSAEFQTRNLLLALRGGEPYRITRVLAVEAVQRLHSATPGRNSRGRSANLLKAADALARKLDNPQAIGWMFECKAAVAYCEGRRKEAIAFSEQAEKIFRDQCTGVAWELDSAQIIHLSAFSYLGEIAELTRRLPLVLQEAQDRGDLYIATYLGSFVTPVVQMAADEPDEARRDLGQLLKQLTPQGFHVQHASRLHRLAEIELYSGNGHGACEHAAKLWSSAAGSLLMRVQHLRIVASDLRARGALAQAARSSDPAPLLRAAERDARRLEREKCPWSDALARLIRAGVASAHRDATGSAALLAGAAAAFDALDMALHAAAARRRLGQLMGGDDGRAMVAQADAWMTAQMIKNPPRMTAMLVPGFP